MLLLELLHCLGFIRSIAYLAVEKRVSLCLRSFLCHFIRSSFLLWCLGRNHLCKSCISLYEVWINLIVGISGPEFEGSGSLEQLPYTLWLFHARELDEDTSGVAEFLDGRLGDTETVDTVAEDIEGIGNGAFRILPDDCDDLVIRGLGIDPGGEVVCAEHLSEPLSS